MTLNIFVLFFMLNLVVSNQQCLPKIYKAHMHVSQWPLVKVEDDCDYVDVFSRTPLNKGYFNVIFRAPPKTVDALKNTSVTFETLVDDIAYVLERSRRSQVSRISEGGVIIPDRPTYNEIIKLLYLLAKRSKPGKIISVTSLGKTFQNRSIPMLKIEYPKAQNIMFLDAGIHAREWLAIMSALYLATQLATTSKSDVGINWYIVPCVNPDGYIQSYTKDRMHRKNMNFKNCPRKCKDCGVDLNRNFGYNYGVAGASTDGCSEDYRGACAFSEPEARALRKVLRKNRKRIRAYVSLHSFGSMILYPWGYANKPVSDWPDLKEAGEVAANAINKHSKQPKPFRVLSSGKDLYPAAGGSDDYAKSINIKYSYTIELQFGGQTGFDPTAKQTRKYIESNFHGIVAMAKFINSKYTRMETFYVAKTNPTNATSNCFLTRAAYVTLYILHALIFFIK